jgi:RNA polymerase sigma factor (sigma-70 family)
LPVPVGVCAECPRRLAADLDAAFPGFLAHHQDLVFGMALRSTRHRPDAEDLAQEAFVRAYRALATYPPERTRDLRLRGWLAAIVGNLARDRARRRTPPTVGPEAAAQVRTDDRAEPERVALQREEAARWQARLATLPPRYRRAVELRHISQLSYPELAEALGRPVGTVKSDVHRGVSLLRQAVLDEAGENGQGHGHRELAS